MDSAKLEELERLAAQATPGPWTANNWGRVWYTPNSDSKRLVCDTMRNTVRNPKKWRANARLIAAMREALPELIAENRALREKVQALEEHKKWLAGYAESAHTCSQCPAKHENLCPPKEEDRARFSRPCVNALIQWAELVTKEDKERTYLFPWEVKA